MITKKELKDLYLDKKLSYSEIAKRKNCSIQTVCNYMKKYKIQARTYSESLSGRKILWKDKIAKANFGKKLSKEVRQKISLSKIGKPAWNKGLTKFKNPDKIKYGKSKDKHWNWKNGISKENVLERQSSKYKSWRMDIFRRDNYTCQICSKKGGYLEAHHKKSFSQYKQLRYSLNNGITLCKECHKYVHRGKNGKKK